MNAPAFPRHMAKQALIDVLHGNVALAEQDFVTDAKDYRGGVFAKDDLGVLACLAEDVRRFSQTVAGRFLALSVAEDPDNRFNPQEFATLVVEMMDPNLRLGATAVVQTRLALPEVF